MSFNGTIVRLRFILTPSAAVLAQSGVVNDDSLRRQKFAAQCVGGISNSLGDGFWRNQPQLESICRHFSMEGFMRSLRSGYVFTALVAIGAILMLPVCGHAQDSTVGGTVMDPSGAVIPGVTMTATHTESGNKFVAVTDETIIPRKGLVGDPIHRVDM